MLKDYINNLCIMIQSFGTHMNSQAKNIAEVVNTSMRVADDSNDEKRACVGFAEVDLSVLASH